jgi:hypothetical protein
VDVEVSRLVEVEVSRLVEVEVSRLSAAPGLAPTGSRPTTNDRLRNIAVQPDHLGHSVRIAVQRGAAWAVPTSGVGAAAPVLLAAVAGGLLPARQPFESLLVVIDVVLRLVPVPRCEHAVQIGKGVTVGCIARRRGANEECTFVQASSVGHKEVSDVGRTDLRMSEVK